MGLLDWRGSARTLVLVDVRQMCSLGALVGEKRASAHVEEERHN